jgi:hypothetical protein
VYHVTRDAYANMVDITNMINRLTGRQFELFKLPAFVPEVIGRCTKDDPLFPLLDFLIGSVDSIASMEFKRYDSSRYRRARSASPWGRPDPSLEDTVRGILRFMNRTGMVPAGVPIPDSERPFFGDRLEEERGIPSARPAGQRERATGNLRAGAVT